MKGRTVTVTIEDNSGNKTHQAFLDVTYNKLTVTTVAITNFLERWSQQMNLPPFLEEKLKAAETVEELKAVIADILEEYNFGILSLLEERISELEAGIK